MLVWDSSCNGRSGPVMPCLGYMIVIVVYGTNLWDNSVADIFLPLWNAGQRAALDVTVTSRLQPIFMANMSAKRSFALSAAKDKNEQYAQKCSEVAFQLIPLPFELFWVLHTVLKTLKLIALLANSRGLQSAGITLAFRRLSHFVSNVAIRGSAIMFIARYARFIGT